MPAAKHTQYSFKHLLFLQLHGSRSSPPVNDVIGSIAAIRAWARCLAAALILEPLELDVRGGGERKLSPPLPDVGLRLRFALEDFVAF